MRVLVCGGRAFTNEGLLGSTLEKIPDIKTIIHGGARGADSLAGLCARLNNIEEEVYYADWDTYGKAAGYIRNKTMLEDGKPDIVVAFPGGKGTAMMVKLAREAGVEVIEVE